MAKYYGDIELIGGRVINLNAEHVTSDPAFNASDEGKIIYNSTENAYKYNNGSSWITFEVSLTSSNALVNTLGNNWINTDFSFNPTDFNTLDNVTGLTSSNSLFDVFNQLDNQLTGAKNVGSLRGVNLNFINTDPTSGNIIYFDGSDFVLGTINDIGNANLKVADLSDASITSVQNNDFLVRENGSWVNKPIFYEYEELSGTLSVFTVNHSLGQRFCHVTVIDRDFATPRIMDPSLITKIEYNNEITLTVTLSTVKRVSVIVSTLNRV